MDGTVDNFTFAFGVGIEQGITFSFANALKDNLFSRLSRNPPEIGRRTFNRYQAAHFGLRVDFFGFR